MKFFLASLFILFSIAASAATVEQEPLPRPELFDARYELDVKEGGKLYGVRLTDAVLRNVRLSYEWDVAVFNASGDIVPFMAALDFPPSGGEGEPAGERAFPVPFYRMPAPRSGRNSRGAPGVSVKTDGEGRVVEVSTVTPDEPGPGRYLLDLSGVARGGQYADGRALEIMLTNAGDSVPTVTLHESYNMRDWSPLASDMPLIPVERGEFPGKSRFVDIPGSPGYLTMELDADDSVELEGVTAWVYERERMVTTIESADFDGTPIPDSNSYLYDTEGAFPAEAVNFVLDSPGIYAATVYSRATSADEWFYEGDIVLSFIERPENTASAGAMKNQGIKIYGGTRFKDSRHWMLSPREKLPSPPRMTISWRPRTIIFMAQGEAPFTLAAGREETPLDGPPLQKTDLLTRILSRGDIALEESRILSRLPDYAPSDSVDAGEEQDEFRKNLPQYLVWAVLVVCALTLSGMAWKLMRAGRTK